MDVRTELIYLWDYTLRQIDQILIYYLLGLLVGSFISVFLKKKISDMMFTLNKSSSISGIFTASLIGMASPLCMYGTIPIVASLHESRMRQEWIAAFMVSSILINPQLFLYSFALGSNVAVLRLIISLLTGIIAGVLVMIFFREKELFSFEKLYESHDHDTDPNPFLRYLKNVGRNLKITFPYFAAGILLTSLYQRYVPREAVIMLFRNNRGLGSLFAAGLGVPLYSCGGGTIPLIKAWLQDGMSLGSAISFMIAGQGTKFTNLGALKIALGRNSFIIYILFILSISVLSGIITDLLTVVL